MRRAICSSVMSTRSTSLRQRGGTEFLVLDLLLFSSVAVFTISEIFTASERLVHFLHEPVGFGLLAMSAGDGEPARADLAKSAFSRTATGRFADSPPCPRLKRSAAARVTSLMAVIDLRTALHAGLGDDFRDVGGGKRRVRRKAASGSRRVTPSHRR